MLIFLLGLWFGGYLAFATCILEDMSINPANSTDEGEDEVGFWVLAVAAFWFILIPMIWVGIGQDAWENN